MFNPIVANVPVTRGVAKRTLQRLHDEARAQGHDRPDLSMHHLRVVGRVEVAAGHYFTYGAITGRCRFVIEGGGEIDPSLVPAEVIGPVLDKTRDLGRVTPPTADEIEETATARLRKRLLATV